MFEEHYKIRDVLEETLFCRIFRHHNIGLDTIKAYWKLPPLKTGFT